MENASHAYGVRRVTLEFRQETSEDRFRIRVSVLLKRHDGLIVRNRKSELAVDLRLVSGTVSKGEETEDSGANNSEAQEAQQNSEAHRRQSLSRAAEASGVFWGNYPIFAFNWNSLQGLILDFYRAKTIELSSFLLAW
jgi:hypothetical protein